MSDVTRQSILNTAKQCVCQDRNDQYGEPEDSFEVIAKLWDAYLDARLESVGKCTITYPSDNTKLTHRNHVLDAHDVGMMMCLLKIARIASGQTNTDNYVDLAGYAACAGEIAATAERSKA